jgi:FkbM family methyltransferase
MIQFLFLHGALRRIHRANEALTRLVYTKLVRSGDHAIDLGANAGEHTRELSRLVGRDGVVHAFEPNIAHFPNLLAIAPNVRLWPFAAGDALRIDRLHIPDELDGFASLKDIRAEFSDRQFRILDTVQIRIDDLSGIDRDKITFIKIDVERHELQALLGMKGLLAAARPIIVFENASAEIITLFRQLGYLVTDFRGTIWSDVGAGLPNSVAFPVERRSEISNWLPTQHEFDQIMIELIILPP